MLGPQNNPSKEVAKGIKLDEAARNLLIYEGPDLDTLPEVVKEKLEKILKYTLEFTAKNELSWKIECKVEELVNWPINTAYESIEFQIDHCSPFNEPIYPEAYQYDDSKVRIRIAPIDKETKEQCLSGSMTLFAPILDEIRKRFKNAPAEDIYAGLSYDIVQATLEVKR